MIVCGSAFVDAWDCLSLGIIVFVFGLCLNDVRVCGLVSWGLGVFESV